MKKITSNVKKEFAVCWPVPSLRWGFIFSSILAGLHAFIMAWPETISVIWASLPEELKAFFPDWLLMLITVAVFLMSALNRIFKNKELQDAK